MYFLFSAVKINEHKHTFKRFMNIIHVVGHESTGEMKRAW